MKLKKRKKLIVDNPIFKHYNTDKTWVIKGVWTPQAIWWDTKLTITQKALLSSIFNLQDHECDNLCYASDTILSMFSKIPKHRVKFHLKNLMKKDRVRIEGHYKGVRFLRVMTTSLGDSWEKDKQNQAATTEPFVGGVT